MTNSIKRIIDNPYGSKFTSTDTETGVTVEIKEATASAFAQFTFGVFLTARAEVNLKSVSASAEIFPGTTAELAYLRATI
jgi:hypothetical protein